MTKSVMFLHVKKTCYTRETRLLLPAVVVPLTSFFRFLLPTKIAVPVFDENKDVGVRQ
jgi:hypothetical protein